MRLREHHTRQWSKKAGEASSKKKTGYVVFFLIPTMLCMQLLFYVENQYLAQIHLAPISRREFYGMAEEDRPVVNCKEGEKITSVPVDDNDLAVDNKYPCASVKSFSSFLKERQDQVFSARNPICPSAAYNHIYVVIPFYNIDLDTLSASIESVKQQDYPTDRWTMLVYDDGSTLEDSNEILQQACSNNVYRFPTPDSSYGSWADAYQILRDLKLMNGKRPNMLCFRSTEHLGRAGGKYWLFGIAKILAGANDVVLVLDGDDKLHNPQALKVVNQKYLDTPSWFTYGSYEGKYSDQIKDLTPAQRNGQEEFKPRKGPWVYGHPRTFKAFLLDHVHMNDFKYSDGSWLQKCTDCAYVYRMLEVSGPERIGYIPTEIYKYHWSSTHSTLATVEKVVRDAHYQHVINAEPSELIQLPVHVIVLQWKRISLLPYQLVWLQNQIGLGRRHIHLHIVNNNPLMVRKIEEILNQFRLYQTQEDLSSLPIEVSVLHKHTTGETYDIFEKFLYVQELRRFTPLEQVIIIDDDFYLPKDYVAKLLADYRPKSMTVWYGKTFERDTKSGYAMYWKPIMGLRDILDGSRMSEISRFKYGGSGGSLWDTNIWLADAQLLRLGADLSFWAKIDDLWASYVVDAVLGWEIRRTGALPVDVGSFREKGIHYQRMTRRLGPDITKELFDLEVEHLKAKGVATFDEIYDEKTDMFIRLQKDFLWDPES